MTMTRPSLTLPHPATTATALPSWRCPELLPFESRFHALDSVTRLHYLDEGPSSAPVLLLVHGSPLWSFTWRWVIAKARRTHRCIAVDLPGLGLSRARLEHGGAYRQAADLLQRFIRELGLERITLGVHATGGPPAFEAAIRERDRIEGLLITNTFAWPLADIPRLGRFVRLVGSPLFSFLNTRLNLLARVTARFARRTGRFTPAERAAIRGPFRERRARLHLQALLSGLRLEHDFFAELEGRLDTLADLPTLFLYGAHDNGYRAGLLDRWRRILPRHRSLVLPDSGHFPTEDEPERFAHEVGRWLGGSRP